MRMKNIEFSGFLLRFLDLRPKYANRAPISTISTVFNADMFFISKVLKFKILVWGGEGGLIGGIIQSSL